MVIGTDAVTVAAVADAVDVVIVETVCPLVSPSPDAILPTAMPVTEVRFIILLEVLVV